MLNDLIFLWQSQWGGWVVPECSKNYSVCQTDLPESFCRILHLDKLTWISVALPNLPGLGKLWSACLSTSIGLIICNNVNQCRWLPSSEVSSHRSVLAGNFNQMQFCKRLFESISDPVFTQRWGVGVQKLFHILVVKHFFSYFERSTCIFQPFGLREHKASEFLWAPAGVVGAIHCNISVICVALIALLFHELQFPLK